jgi:hypothetical protein
MCFAVDKGAGAAYTVASQAQGLAKDLIGSAQRFLTFYDGFIGELKSKVSSQQVVSQQLSESRGAGLPSARRAARWCSRDH